MMNSRTGARKLTTIVATDIVGYSRLMGEDESGTLATIKAHRRELIEPKTAQYGGRTVKLMGDGALMEFASVIDALHFAIEFQCLMDERSHGVPENRQFLYRIGINIGDIMIDGDDIYGDGVNIASRIESLAEPGGICLARSAYNQVNNKLDIGFEELGSRKVKNIAQPVSIYRVKMDERAFALVTPVLSATTTKTWRQPVIAAGIVLLVTVVGGLFWKQPWAPDFGAASVERMAFPLPDKPSIAVLAFDNLSEDTQQAYFADGMVDDLITDLSKVPDLFVIARNSSFTYRGKATKVQQVAEDLGVRYVVEGSVRRAGDRVRINVQLIDALKGNHLWAERYDGSTADLFDLQDRITAKIVAALVSKLASGNGKEGYHQKETDNPDAYDEFLKGWEQHLLRSPEGFRLAIKHFNNSIALDPNYSRAYAALAATYWEVYNRYWFSEIGLVMVHDALNLAETMLDKALKNPTPLALQISAMLNSRQAFHDDAITDAERAISLDPNDANGYVTLASVSTLAGEPEKAVELIRKAMRLNPYFPSGYLHELGVAQYSLGQYSKAADALERASALSPEDTWPTRLLLAVYGQLNRQEDVNRMMSKIKRYHFGFDSLTIKSLAFWYPFKKREHAMRLAEGLRKAGVPD